MKKKHKEFVKNLSNFEEPAGNNFELVPSPKFSRFPFVRRIETNENERIYTFCPTKATEFRLGVIFPLDEWGNLRIAVYNQVEIEQLNAAIKFVESNEAQFSEAFFESQPRNKAVEVSEIAFQQL